MTHPKREKSSNNKDTRWDRIRKRHCSNISTNLKSDAVKKFIEIDYIGRHQQNIMKGDNSSQSNLDPVLVMNLRHEMFKKIPRKLPLATVAYAKNLQQCKEHNIAVEDHYIENQLNQFRMHLQKQHKQNRVPEKKLHSLLIDNTEIIKSLESSHKHIEDFYNTPIDALQEVHDLFTDELEKHVKLMEDKDFRERKSNTLEMEENTLENNRNNEIIGTEVANFLEEKELLLAMDSQKNNGVKPEENIIDFMAERMNELNFNNEIFDLNSQIITEENCQRTPSPLANTDEILKPLREVIEEQNVSHLRCVRFDTDINVCQLKRESSVCSNTSDGIDSVISDLAEEALKELEMEEEFKLEDILEENNSETTQIKHNLILNGCSLHNFKSETGDLIVTGKTAHYVKSSEEENENVNTSESSSKALEDNTYSHNEKSNIIENLFQTCNHNNTSIMRKYFLKWIHYTNIEKIEREHVDGRADRVKKINIFLDKIRIEKTRLKHSQKTESESAFENDHKKCVAKKDTSENVKVNKKYQNKIKVQQDIIDLQRLKLERQERIIMELKLHKLSEEAKEARQELKNELKSVIRSGDPKSKAKAKCLQLIGNLKDEEDDNLNKLQGKALLMPKFLQNMQERALERSIRHEQAKQRRLQQEAEREAQKLALEEAKRQEDEEAKRLRIEALREKRRQEKMAKIIKERERQKYLENQRKAQEFYKRNLLKRIGMESFKRLLQRKRDNLKKCEELRRSLYKKTYFQAWFSLYRILKARRNQKADELYEKILKRQYLQIWLQYVYEERSKFNVAVDYHEFKLSESMFRQWWTYTKRMQMVEETKMKQAVSHHEWHLKWKVLDCWQRLPQILQLEKETEERRQRWRLKIWELLPDYTPNRDDLNFM
ncbi:hypothetical protein FF38_08988 [Lucilia cuprina]|uniref:Coiled-coil domain-containing protein KIAA1407 n=1 Tax=Lucilia cuprina TaxID=7375 RepID=A0A0L0CQY5_LUCCU|nr:hypothetical protein FF38_08988 [Lucilia cuprina]